MTEEKREDLEADHKNTERTLSLARHVMGKLVRPVRVDEDLLQHWVLPSADFSGDVVAAAMTAGNRLHVILADGTGHGLSAALCMMPVSEIFYAMTEKGFPIGSIARELNKKMYDLLPRDRFIAATLASIDWPNKTIEIWNGGGPPAFFLSESGQCLNAWKSKFLPIGVLSDKDFEEKVEVFQWNEPGQLFLHSDGLTDARNPQDMLFGTVRMHSTLLEVGCEQRFEHLKKSVMAHAGALVADDDISLVVVHCKLTLCGAMELEQKIPQPSSKGLGSWKLSLHLDEMDIKEVDILPILLTWLKQTGIAQKNCQRMFLILSELYNNAVDHGLLGLDSTLKTSSEGFEGYLNVRNERLLNLSNASIDIHLERIKKLSEDYLYFRIKDSGPGFDFVAHLKGKVACVTALAGRGIHLVYSLSRRMTYLNSGNEVEVEYLLSHGEKPASE